MELFDILAILLSLTAGFAYLNHRFIGLPVTIGVMVIALLASLLLQMIDLLGFHLGEYAAHWLVTIDFNKTLLHGMLSYLLFAGALHVNLGDLQDQKWTIGLLATVGTVISTFLVGGHNLVGALPLRGASSLHHVPGVWGTHFADRPHCRVGNFEKCWSSQTFGSQNHRRIVV